MREKKKIRLLIKFYQHYQHQTMKAILSIMGASCLALAAGCTNLIEIAEGFNANRTENKDKPQETKPTITQESAAAPTTQAPPQSQAESNRLKQNNAIECIVLDPNDTYANARTTPNGTIVGPLANGTRVQVIGELNDSSGRPWSEVSFGSAGTTGYVFKKLLTSCQ